MAMAGAQLAAQIQRAGVELDLRRDVLENLGGELVMVQSAPTLIDPDADPQSLVQQQQVMGLSIKQRQSFELAIEALKTMAGQGSELFESREYIGNTIYTLKLQQATGTIAYTITDGYLFVSFGSPEALESVLVQMGARGTTVWDQAPVRRALAALPEGAAGLSYQDMGELGHTMLEAMATVAGMELEDPAEVIDPEAIPDPDTIGKYLGPAVTAVYKDGSSLLLRTRMLASTSRDSSE
jgi:hypothetical protein